MKVLVIGGTGVISRCIVEQLLERGDEVSVYNRGRQQQVCNTKVEQIFGDRQDRDGFAQEMRQRRFDVVIDMICFNKEDAQSTLNAFNGRVGQIIVTSSVAAYKRPYRTVPTIESEEALWDDPAFGYAFHKAEMERYLQSAAHTNETPVTIIRPSLTYGPGAANIGVLRQNYGIIDRLRKGKPLVMFGDGTTPWCWTFAPDLAGAFLALAGNPKTYGKQYHACSEEGHIWQDLYTEIGKIIGIEPKIIHIPSELLKVSAPNLCGHLYWEKSHAGLFNNAKLRQDAPGFKMNITLTDGLKAIVEWFEKEAAFINPEKDQLEDRLVECYGQWEKQIANLYTK